VLISQDVGRCRPPAPRSGAVDVLHGHAVADPYRPLEDRGDARTERWLAVQDALYARHLAALSGHERLAERLARLHAVGAVGLPMWRGQRWFATVREAGQELDVLCTGRTSDDGRVLLDPNAGTRSARTTLDGWIPSRSGALLAYQVSDDGTEEPTLWVIDVASGEVVDGPIDRIRHGSVAWLSDDSGFYYSRRLPPGDVPKGEEQYHRRVYLHRLGRSTDTDVLVFGEGRDRTSIYRLAVSPDGRWLIIHCSKGASGRNDVWIADLDGCDRAAPDLRAVQEAVDARTTAQVGPDGRLYLLTDLGSPRRRLAVADPAAPQRHNWTDLLSEDEETVLTAFGLLDVPERDEALVLAARSRHAVSEMTVHDRRSGELVDVLRLPGLGSVSGLAEHPDGGSRIWFGYTDFRTPPTVMCYDARASRVEQWRQPPGTPDLPAVETRQVVCQSADGTAVRMLVLAPPGALDGASGTAPLPRPTLLHGYGGFGVRLAPAYSPNALAWVEAGGFHVVAWPRGGGEEGEAWHRAGMRELKQNTFDDFHAVAKHLVAAGWTGPQQLCASGGSNGGLLVGAAITQWPELFGAALCQAPLLDMARYEQSGLGQMWIDEYGSVEDPAQFAALLAYSPYHRVRDGTAYPAVLFLTFEADTRVDPMHAWKMCAALQQATSTPERPILLRRESQVGHGVRAVSRSIALGAEKLAFAAAHTGLRL
jgi:prolyl oligopeptidase